MTQRQLFIGILVAITLVVGGISAYIGFQLSTQDTAPSPSAAAIACGAVECLDGRRAGADCNYAFGSCRDRAVAFCGEGNFDPDRIDLDRAILCEAPTNPDAGGQNCQVDNPSVTDSYIALGSACANGGTVEVHIQDAGARSSSSECVGTSNQVGTRSLAPGGRIDVGSITSECGKCVQIDMQYNGRNYGSATYTGECSSPPPTEPPTTPPPTETTFDCNESFQCVAVNGSGGEFASELNCEAACEPPTPQEAICGDTCDPADATSCPNDHTCSPDTNTCVLNECFEDPSACDPSQCIVLGVDPVCGDNCNPDDPLTCPTDHTCSEDTRRCVLNACLTGDAECDDNQCAVLPDTALGLEDGNPYLVLSIITLLLGAIFFLLRDVPYIQNMLLTLDENTGLLKLKITRKRRVDKTRENFEKRFQ